MRKNGTKVYCKVSNCIYEKEGKCCLDQVSIKCDGRGNDCFDSSSTLCDSFSSRGNPTNLNYEFASENDSNISFDVSKKETMIMD